MTSRPLLVSFGGADVACGAAASDLGAEEDDLFWDVFPLARLDSRDSMYSILE